MDTPGIFWRVVHTHTHARARSAKTQCTTLSCVLLSAVRRENVACDPHVCQTSEILEQVFYARPCRTGTADPRSSLDNFTAREIYHTYKKYILFFISPLPTSDYYYSIRNRKIITFNTFLCFLRIVKFKIQ